MFNFVLTLGIFTTEGVKNNNKHVSIADAIAPLPASGLSGSSAPRHSLPSTLLGCRAVRPVPDQYALPADELMIKQTSNRTSPSLCGTSLINTFTVYFQAASVGLALPTHTLLAVDSTLRRPSQTAR